MDKTHLIFILFMIVQTSRSQNQSLNINYFAGTLPEAVEAVKSQNKPKLENAIDTFKNTNKCNRLKNLLFIH